MDKLRNLEKYKELRQRHKDELVELLMQYADYTIKEAARELEMTDPYLRTLGWQLNIPFKKSIRSNQKERKTETKAKVRGCNNVSLPKPPFSMEITNV